MADWCGPCIEMQPAWEQLKEDLKGEFLFESVDIESNPSTREQYFVRMIPTLILVREGKELARRQSGGTLEELKVWLANEQRNIQ